MTLLNTANKLYVGATAIDKVYAGANLVWQPPATGAWGPNEGIYLPSATPVTAGVDAQTFSVGNNIRILVDGRITGIRHWRASNSSVTSHSVDIWTDAGASLAHGMTTGDVVGWNTFAITPIDVKAGDLIRVVHAHYGSGAGDSWPYTDTAHTSASPHLQWVQGVFGLPVDSFPNQTTGGYNYFVDVVFQEKLAAVTGPSAKLMTSFTPGAQRTDFQGELGVRLNIIANKTFTWIGAHVGATGLGPNRVAIYDWFTLALIVEGVVDFTGKAIGDWAWVQVPAFTLATDPGYYAVVANTYYGTGWSNLGPTAFNPSFTGNIYSCYRGENPTWAFDVAGTDTQFFGLDLGW